MITSSNAIYRYFITANSCLFITLLLFQWFALLKFGSLNFKQFHIFMMLMFMGVLFKDFRLRVWAFVKRFQVFLMLYLVLYVMYFMSFFWAPDLGLAISFLFKTFVYYLVFILFAVFLMEMVRLNMTKYLCYAAAIGIVLFIIYAYVAFKMMNMNVFQTIAVGLLSGNPKLLMYGFYKELFNFDIWTLSNINNNSDEAVLTSMKNNLATGFLIYFYVISLFQRKRNLVLSTAKYMALGFLLLTVSRSNIIGFAASAFLFVFLTFEKKLPQYLLLGLLGITIVGSFFIMFSEQILSATSALLGRFTEIQEGSRLDMYDIAVEKISARPWFGYGLAAKGEFEPGHEGYIHNFMLNNWYMSGVFCFLAGLIFYLYLLFGFAFKMLKYKLKRILPLIPFSIEWMLVLPAQPLFRVQVSGGAGDFSLMEWLILSFYFALLFIYIEEIKRNKERKILQLST